MGFQSKKSNLSDLVQRSQWMRRTLFEMVVKHGAGCLPSCLSMVEVLISLYYGGVANVVAGEPRHAKRDRILISKGHAAMAQYPILADYGFFPKAELERFSEPGGLLGIYADFRVPGIEGISGSLGHGIGMGAGICLAARADGQDHRSFVVVGDGECYEGSIWESAMFAAHHRLENLVVVVDRNQLCILGRTEELLSLGSLEDKWRSFGWDVASVDGHSYKALLGAFDRVGHTDGKPYVIISNSVKGKGISFMEGNAEWHNKIPNEQQIARAREDLSVNCISV